MIRKIRKEDISKIYDLGKIYDNRFSSLYDLESYINDNKYEIYVSENDNINGFIILTNMYNIKEILLIYVDEKYRGKGIGSKLLKEIENNGDKILLEVSIENIPAISLYKKFDYKVINIRKGYYNGVDAYVMEKKL